MNGQRSSAMATLLLLLGGCSVTPLTNKIQVGREPFVLAVGEGPDSLTDLYAAPASGGSFVRLTFTRAEEAAPRLNPSGTSVAFVRQSEADRWALVVLDLLTNKEETATIPQGAGRPQAVGWTRDGGLGGEAERVVVKAYGYLSSPAPPRKLWLTAVRLDSVGWADSVTSQLLGEPPAARIGLCSPRLSEYCVYSATGEMTRLEPEIRDPIRWGTDSMAYLTPTGLEVRPLTGGRTRRPSWSSAPFEIGRASCRERVCQYV